jgi:hypothetical protein
MEGRDRASLGRQGEVPPQGLRARRPVHELHHLRVLRSQVSRPGSVRCRPAWREEGGSHGRCLRPERMGSDGQVVVLAHMVGGGQARDPTGPRPRVRPSHRHVRRVPGGRMRSGTPVHERADQHHEPRLEDLSPTRGGIPIEADSPLRTDKPDWCRLRLVVSKDVPPGQLKESDVVWIDLAPQHIHPAPGTVRAATLSLAPGAELKFQVKHQLWPAPAVTARSSSGTGTSHSSKPIKSSRARCAWTWAASRSPSPGRPHALRRRVARHDSRAPFAARRDSFIDARPSEAATGRGKPRGWPRVRRAVQRRVSRKRKPC